MKNYREKYRQHDLPITSCEVQGDGETVIIRRCDDRIEFLVGTDDGFPPRSVKLNKYVAEKLITGAARMVVQVIKGL